MKGKGIGGHQSPVNETAIWLTPPRIISALGCFDLDPCAHLGWPTANNHITPPDDGLKQRWYGRVWLNPPYGAPSIVRPWLERMVFHNHGTALLFARTETDLFHDCVWPAASAMFFLRGRLYFHYPDGTLAANNSGAPSVLIAYGKADAQVLRNVKLSGKFIELLT